MFTIYLALLMALPISNCKRNRNNFILYMYIQDIHKTPLIRLEAKINEKLIYKNFNYLLNYKQFKFVLDEQDENKMQTFLLYFCIYEKFMCLIYLKTKKCFYYFYI